VPCLVSHRAQLGDVRQLDLTKRSGENGQEEEYNVENYTMKTFRSGIFKNIIEAIK
jgi:hypothetical protein